VAVTVQLGEIQQLVQAQLLIQDKVELHNVQTITQEQMME
jgi:hypothetical protein